MKKMFKKYLWLFEFIGAALILALGVLVKINDEVLYLIVGLVFIILGLFRVIPLIKTTDDKLLRWIYLAEVVINVAVGATLMVLYFKQSTDQGKLFGYLIGGVLYLRALIYFFATTLRKETTDVTKFITHIILITLGSMIIVKGGFEQAKLALVILILSILTTVVLSFNGYSNYNNYRHEYRAVEKSKEISLTDEKTIELPAHEEDIIPINEEKIQDERTIQ